MGDISLNSKQQRKLEVIARLTSGKLTEPEAAVVLRCSARTIRRLLRRWEEQGASSVVHGNAGRVPGHKTSSELRRRIIDLAGDEGKYQDFNVCHMRSMLRRQEHALIGRSTLDRLLKEAGIRKPNRAVRRRIFRRRQRSAQEGFMLLIDGSLHDWLEGRAPDMPKTSNRTGKMCLIGAVDDATGKVLYLRFWPTECLAGYLAMLEGIAREHGLPMLFYHDKHTILRSPKKATIEDDLAGREPMSQFQEVLSLLGIEGIPAHSPQAKGRIERLWETLQERLVKELRLSGATTLEQANDFLPPFMADYNEEFGVAAADPEPAWVAIDPKMDFAYYFASKEQRLVRPDHTVSWLGRTFSIGRKAKQFSLAGKKVSVHTDARAEVFLYYGKERLTYQPCQPSQQPVMKAAQATSQGEAANVKTESRNPRGKPSDNAGTRAWLYAPT